MGRRPTTPAGSISVSAKLPPHLQVAVQQFILDMWKKTGRKPSQNQVFAEALQEYLKNRGVDISQIEQAVGKWTPKQNRRASITKFPKKQRNN